MKKQNLFWGVLAFMMAMTLSVSFTSCGGDDGGDDKGSSGGGSGGGTSTLTVAPTELKLTANAGAYGSFAISAQGEWTVSSNETWLSLSQDKGSGAGAIVVTATEENPLANERKATVTVRSGMETKYVTVKQEASEVLSVSGLDAPFDASAGSIQTAQELVITCNSTWNISGKPDWLDISALSGTGNSNIKVWTNKANNSTMELSATLTITSGSKTVTKTVTQRSGLDPELEVSPNKIVVLATGYAFDFNFGSKVKYYYVTRYLPTALERKTDDEIIAEMSANQDNRDTPGDGYVTSWQNQSPSTEYIICTVGYDQNGKHGALKKTSITTKKSTNQALATISDVQYDDTYWYWTTSVNGFVTKYYQWFVSRTDLYDSSDAAIAWFFNEEMQKNPSNFSPIAQGDSWRRQRNGGNIFHMATWAIDVDGNFSGVIGRFAGSVSSSSSSRAMKKNYVEIQNETTRFKTYK